MHMWIFSTRIGKRTECAFYYSLQMAQCLEKDFIKISKHLIQDDQMSTAIAEVFEESDGSEGLIYNMHKQIR